MPSRTKKQQRFMGLCANSPSKAVKPCPPKKVAQEFARKPGKKK